MLAAIQQRLDGSDPVALTNFAWFAARSGRMEPALAAARRAAALPRAPRAAWRALERLAIGRTDGLTLAAPAAAARPHSAHEGSPLVAAVAAHRQAALAVAEACYHAALQDGAHAAGAWNGIAVLHEQRGELSQADEAWNNSLIELPQVAAVHNRALAWLRRGHPEQCRETLGHHSGLVGDSAPLLFLLGYAAFLGGDAALARVSIERALQCDPELARAQFTLGLVHERLGNPDAALAATRRGLLMSPWYLPQVWLLAPSRAGALVEIPATDPQTVTAAGMEEVLLDLGRSLLGNGHLGESIAVFDQVLLRDAGHTAALFHRGVVLA
ncbi:MAG TPA: tetratricopeptide repeat protein, partial [Gemmatimonadales bacterium]|nr:tetratricopeptide repeat protein [Gemmatimonadales bacterium]